MQNYLRKLLRPFAIWVLVLICLTAFALMYRASNSESAIMDELAHIPSGYGYVHNFDYRLNPEHPPLVKALAMAPVMFLDTVFPTQSTAWTTDINGQWRMGYEFLYNSRNDADQIIHTARIFPILITVLLIALIYIWSREILGDWWALLPTALFALSPTVLAHGHYVTTDVGAAFGFVFSIYYFLKFIERPSHRHLVYAGLALGFAELAKFSAVLLLPYFLFLLVALYFVKMARDWRGTTSNFRAQRFWGRAFKYVKAFVVILAIGYIVVVYPVYALFTKNYPPAKQTADTEFILGSFAGGPTQPGRLCNPMRCVANLDIWMTQHAVTRPVAQYLLGVLMVLQRSAGGNTDYFLGEVSSVGSRLYFPVVYLLKEPLPTLVVVFAAIVYSFWEIVKKIKKDRPRLKENFLNWIELSFTEFSMFAVIVLYWGYSMKSPLNIGFRHLFPTLPFIYILSAKVWKRWVVRRPDIIPGTPWLKAAGEWLSSIFSSALKYVFLVILMVWLAAETALATPYFLSYFNELGGGVWGGYRYVTDSNYDWGQDLLRLKQWVDEHPEADKVAVDYFGGGNPQYYLGDKEIDWSSSKGNPEGLGIHWLAVSVNTLQGATKPLAPGQERNPQDSYSWLTSLRPPKPGLGNVSEPDARAGTSIFIYKL